MVTQEQITEALEQVKQIVESIDMEQVDAELEQHLNTKLTSGIDWTTIERDTEIQVSNARGRFFFRGITNSGAISVWGGAANQQMRRAFVADRCRPIHQGEE